MSFSRAAGWTGFLALMVWLYIVCDRKDKIEQYTVDKRLTQKIDRIGSDVFNRLDARESKVKAKNREFVQKYPRIENHVREIKNVRKHHFNYVQISVIFTALVSLIVLFTDSGASAYTQRMYCSV